MRNTFDLPFIQKKNSRQKKMNNFESTLNNQPKANYPHVIKEINNKINGASSPNQLQPM
jgi:hypothetical protein